MLRSIGVFVFAGKAMGLSPCNNYDLKDGSKIEVGSHPIYLETSRDAV